MKNQYEYTINSSEDIGRALEEAEREGYDLTYYTSAFYLRGEAGKPITVDASLKDLFVTAYGPAPVYVFGDEVTVTAENSSTVYAMSGSVVDASDSATVYAYDRAEVDVSMNASVYAASDDVVITAYGDSRVYLPAPGIPGSEASVSVPDPANLIQAESPALVTDRNTL